MNTKANRAANEEMSSITVALEQSFILTQPFKPNISFTVHSCHVFTCFITFLSPPVSCAPHLFQSSITKMTRGFKEEFKHGSGSRPQTGCHTHTERHTPVYLCQISLELVSSTSPWHLTDIKTKTAV